MINNANPDKLASLKQTDMALHCFHKWGIPGFSRTRTRAQLFKANDVVS